MPPNQTYKADLVQQRKISDSVLTFVKAQNARTEPPTCEPSYWDWQPDEEITRIQREETARAILSADHIISNLREASEAQSETKKLSLESGKDTEDYWYRPGSAEEHARRLTSVCHIEENLRSQSLSTSCSSAQGKSTSESASYWDESPRDSRLEQERARVLVSAEHIQGNLMAFSESPRAMALVPAHDDYWAM